MDARITLLASAQRVKNRARVHFHQGTAETIAEVILLEGDELRAVTSAFAQLRLNEKVLLLPGDRFILRQFSPVVTIGGGIGCRREGARGIGATKRRGCDALQVLARGKPRRNFAGDGGEQNQAR